MYVAKFSKKGLLWQVDLLDKQWSNMISSHEVKKLGSQRFLLHSSASRWVRNETIKHMVKLHKLEILNG